MKGNIPNQIPALLTSTILVAGLLGGAQARADSNLWTGGADMNWSNAANWTNGVPTAATDVYFNTNGAVADTTTINNIVDANITVKSLLYQHRPALFHNTQIADGVTLTVASGASSTNVFLAGANTNASTWSPATSTTIWGQNGKLVIDATNGFIQVRNGGNTSFGANSRAILDMSQLGTFSANASRFYCGGDGSTLLGSGITANYMFDRSSGIVYLAKTNLLTFNSTTDFGIRVCYTTASVDNAPGSQFYLGDTNAIFSDYGLAVGGQRSGTSLLSFTPGSAGSSAYFRSRSGGRQAYWYIGHSAGSGYTSSGGALNTTADFSQGSVDAMVNVLRVGVGANYTAAYALGANSYVKSTLLMGPGTVDANNVLIGWHYQPYAPYVIGTVTLDGSQGSSKLIVNSAMTLGQFNKCDLTNGYSQAILKIQSGAAVTVYGKITTLFADPENADSQIHVTANSSLYVKGIASLQTLQLSQSSLTLDLSSYVDPAIPVCTITNLDLTSPVTLNIAGRGGVSVGQYKLIKYMNLPGEDFNALTLKMPLDLQGYLSNNVANSSIDLVITGNTYLTWNGTNNGVWDINSTANWKTASGSPVTYKESGGTGDITIFDDTAQGTTTVSLTGTLNPSSVTISNTSKAYTFGGEGLLAGPMSMIKASSGELTLSNTGTNTFTGGLYIRGGTVTLGSSGWNGFSGGVRLEAGTLRLGGAENLLPSSADVIFGSGATLDLNGANQILSSISGGGSIALGSGGLTVTLASTYNGVISGGGRLTNAGPGLILTGANTYSGGTRINSGIVSVGNATGSGTGSGDIDMGSGASLRIGLTNNAGSVAAATITNNGTIIFSRTDNTTFDSFVVGSGALQFLGAGYSGGTVTINRANANSNTTWIVNGKLRITHPNAMGWGAVTIANGLYDGCLELLGDITVTNLFTLGPKDGTVNGDLPNIVNVAGTNTISGPFNGTRGGADFVLRADSGQLIISRPFVNGATTVATYNMRLRGAASGIFNGMADGTTANVKNTLYKQDNGTWTLTGASTYTGNTYVQGGSLIVNGSIARTPAVTVDAGATLGGSGFIGGPVTINDGGILAPGTSAGALTITNTLTLMGNATNVFEVGGPSGYDRVQGVTDLTMGGVLKVKLNGTLYGGEVFRLFSANTYYGVFSSVELPTLPSALTWDPSELAVNGTLRVVGGIHVSQVGVLADGNFMMSGTGSTNLAYRILATTNMAEPLNSWTQVGSGTFTGGTFTYTDLNATNHPRRFYMLVTP